VCSGQSFTFMPTGASTYTFVAGGSNVQTPIIPSSVASATVTYVINGTSAAGCLGTGSASITAYSLPSLTVVSSPTATCNGLSAQLSVSGANSYTWSTGATTPAISVSPTITTTYSVTGVRSSTGCRNTATTSIAIYNCVGIENLATNEPVLSIYPNPSKGDFTIATDKEMTLSLINHIGQVVKTVSLNASNHYKADISNLANGLYSIIGEDRQQLIKQKIVVSK
ncbi:MAG: T9SS type A sorting domain-containing protein, partial [Bacteroidia bacterium]|nr:T9SS type A sorting domain-containing protein [Bacteroidia bacterium]